MRITSANKSELIVIIYDIIEENLTLAEEALDNKKVDFKPHLKKALPFVKELLISLNMEYEISHTLASLYIYVMRCLNFALVSGKKEEIESAKKVIKKLGHSFRKIAETDNSLPLMENTQKVYAGLTYGKGHLDETMTNDVSRGFRI